MKISKLFHWLYSVIMLLPIFAIGSTCLISTFNMSSKQESEIIYKYESNEVVYNSDLVIGNYYAFDFRQFFKEGILNGEVFQDDGSYIMFDNCYLRSDFDLSLPFDFRTYDSDASLPMYNGLFINCGLNTDGFNYVAVGFGDFYISGFNYVSDLNAEYYNRIYGRLSTFSFDLYNEYADLSDFIHKCPDEFIPIETIETHNLNVQDIFYDSIEKVRTSPLFSWAYDSFLVAPFAYIVSLFSMPFNSFVVQMLSYWLAISIIWLVFDLIMYVPLLVHRWLDKGVLE